MNLMFKSGLLGLMLMITTSADAEGIGRLFFTPKQRAQLEYSQQQSGNLPGSIHALTVNGIVQKQGGGRTVWVNGAPQLDDNSDERAPESSAVAVPGQSQPARIRVGQTVLINPAISEQ